MNNAMRTMLPTRINELKKRLNREHGFSLVTAIFLLVVLAGLGVAMVTISTTQHQSSGLDVQGVRAYQAARGGIEWGVYQWLRGDQTNKSRCSSTMTLSGFTVVVGCIPGEANTVVITSTACNIPTAGGCPNPGPNNADYVQRVVEVRL